MKNNKAYLSLLERTTNFKKLPTNSIFELVGNQLLVKADFILKHDINCALYVMFYDGNELIESNAIEYTGERLEKLISTPENAKKYRIAIRIEGTGLFQVNSLTIRQKLDFYINEDKRSNKSEKVEFDKIDTFKSKINNFVYHRQVKNKALKVAAILDEFSQECFKYDSELLPLSNDNWKSELKEFNPDFLFVESCWRGNSGSWTYEVANLHVNKHRKKLKELTDFCRNKNIKTVFWDKEGVENFDFFKESACYFDYIFTADENNIENFKKFTKNENVFELAFAAQPQIHNPMYKNRNRLGEIAFGGSYYNNKHDLRKRDIENMIQPSLKYGIDIFDRYYNVDPEEVPNNQWPRRVQKKYCRELKL